MSVRVNLLTFTIPSTMEGIKVFNNSNIASTLAIFSANDKIIKKGSLIETP